MQHNEVRRDFPYDLKQRQIHHFRIIQKDTLDQVLMITNQLVRARMDSVSIQGTKAQLVQLLAGQGRGLTILSLGTL
jgi:hypothetical protein